MTPSVLGGFEVKDKLELCQLLDRQIGRLRTLQKFGDLIGAERVKFLGCDAITREAPGFDHIAPLADRRDPGSEVQLSKPLPHAGEQRRRHDINAFGVARPQRLEGRL